MLVMRPVSRMDIDDLLRLSKMAGSGMTSLPPNREALLRNIDVAEASFSRSTRDRNDDFLLVMEDSEKKKVVGTSAVHARTGTRQAFYSYRLMSVNHYSHSLNKETRAGLLHLTNDYTDYSEVGTLFLDPEYRGNGFWLSRSRYMLMAQHADRFADNVIAELRGIIDENGESPVWNAIGQHFFCMTYDEADRMCGVGSNQFITELMPKYPIYTNLLADDARQALGQPHKATRRAMELLLDEGFVYENLIDIFDGGPLVRAQVSQLKSVQAAVQGTVKICDQVEAPPVMCANKSLDKFRLVFQPARYEDGQISVTSEVAAILGCQQGDQMMMIGSEK